MARSIPVNFMILCMLFGVGWGLFIDFLVIRKPLREWPLATHIDRAMVACMPVTCAILAPLLLLAVGHCPRRAAAARNLIPPATIAPIATGTKTEIYARKKILTAGIVAPPPQINSPNTDLEAQIIGKNLNALTCEDQSTPQLPAYTATASETPQAPPPTYSPSGRL